MIYGDRRKPGWNGEDYAKVDGSAFSVTGFGPDANATLPGGSGGFEQGGGGQVGAGFQTGNYNEWNEQSRAALRNAAGFMAPFGMGALMGAPLGLGSMLSMGNRVANRNPTNQFADMAGANTDSRSNDGFGQGGSVGGGANLGGDMGGLGQAYRTGGMIPDDGDGAMEQVQIRAHEGEYVLRPEAARFYGADVMEALNTREIPRETLARLLMRDKD